MRVSGSILRLSHLHTRLLCTPLHRKSPCELMCKVARSHRRVLSMRIEHIRSIKGPNVFSHRPVLVMRLDLENLAGKESHEIPGFIARLLEALPGVREHVCGKGYAG